MSGEEASMTTIDFITALLAPCTDGVISGNKAGQIFCQPVCTGNFVVFQPILAAVRA
jgi:hypothetical protein